MMAYIVITWLLVALVDFASGSVRKRMHLLEVSA